MIGIIIATHGKMSDGIKDAAELIMGGTDSIETLNLFHGDDVSELGNQLTEAINKVDDGNGTIIFADLFGASPYNQSLLAINALPEDKKDKVYVITGVNLPMILVALTQNMVGASVEDAVASILEEASNSMVVWPTNDETDEDDDEDDF